MSMSLVTELSDRRITGVQVSPAYGPRVPVLLDASPDDVNGEGAVQSFKEECDINNIMRKFQRTGMLEWLNTHDGEFADVTGVNFENAMETILRAQSMFDDLPSSVRDRFGNNPAAFFDFVHDPGNVDELRKLGLARPLEPVAPVVPVAPAG